MGIFSGWSKNPNPPRVVIECGENPNIYFENIDSTEECLAKLVRVLFSINHGQLRTQLVTASQQEKNVPDPVQRRKIIELWAALEKQRKTVNAAPKLDPNYFIKPSEVIPIAIAKDKTGEDE